MFSCSLDKETKACLRVKLKTQPPKIYLKIKLNYSFELNQIELQFLNDQVVLLGGWGWGSIKLSSA